VRADRLGLIAALQLIKNHRRGKLQSCKKLSGWFSAYCISEILPADGF